MSPPKKLNATKREIIQVATRLFLERGFTDTSVKLISDALEISTGNLTFHFHTKDDMLAVLVEMLCNFQWKSMEEALQEGSSTLMTLCLELASMAAICDENEIARDFYISAYVHPSTLDIIRTNDKKKAKKLFASYCPGWEDRQFAEAENLVSGIEYATLMSTPASPELSVRISSALRTIMKIYNVPDPVRDECIQKVLQMDYRTISRSVLQEFKTYVRDVSETQLEQYLLKP